MITLQRFTSSRKDDLWDNKDANFWSELMLILEQANINIDIEVYKQRPIRDFCKDALALPKIYTESYGDNGSEVVTRALISAIYALDR